MKSVKVYTKNYCPFCHRVKDYLKASSIEFEEIDLTNNEAGFKELVVKTGSKTVPQVFIDEQFIGGCDDTVALGEKGELQTMIAL